MVVAKILLSLEKGAACRGHDEKTTMIVTRLGIERPVDWPWAAVSFLVLRIFLPPDMPWVRCMRTVHASWLGTK